MVDIPDEVEEGKDVGVDVRALFPGKSVAVFDVHERERSGRAECQSQSSKTKTPLEQAKSMSVSAVLSAAGGKSPEWGIDPRGKILRESGANIHALQFCNGGIRGPHQYTGPSSSRGISVTSPSFG